MSLFPSEENRKKFLEEKKVSIEKKLNTIKRLFELKLGEGLEQQENQFTYEIYLIEQELDHISYLEDISSYSSDELDLEFDDE